MKKDQQTGTLQIEGPVTNVEIDTPPFMGIIFLKALGLSLLRFHSTPGKTVVKKTRFILKNYQPDIEQINAYKKICSFSSDPCGTVPISFLQIPFTGLLGRFITSSFFPLNPLGLIHVFQSFDLKRPVTVKETLDLACTLSSMKKTEKGIETDFILKATSRGELVWQGLSTFLLRSRKKNPAKREHPPHQINGLPMETEERLHVPADTGRQYATVSGDYNPYHLFSFPAKLFGFKKAIAHGMWSLASVIARLEQHFNMNGPVRVEAYFKRPVFMPAETILGYECKTGEDKNQVRVNFGLRDQEKGIPHIKGRLLYPGSVNI